MHAMKHVTKGIVFEDLGFSPEESERMALQVFLGEQIRTFIKRNNLTQSKAAAFFGVQQPKISKIMNEDLEGMSIDYLVKMVAQTGGRLNYTFRQPRKLSKQELEERIEAA
jgi:predicted XRE-type DNA-binding protein